MHLPGLFHKFLHTDVGDFLVAATEKGIVKIEFPEQSKAAISDSPTPAKIRKIFDRFRRAFQCYFDMGSGGGVLRCPIDFANVSDFERKVFVTLRKRVGFGKTVSYLKLAAMCGKPKSARAVGGALGRNPFPVLVPCHRVVRSDGSLGGFSGGAKWKERLLVHEALRQSFRRNHRN